MKKVASCSFGKDSLAAIIVSEEHGVHIDEAIYCRIMFDDQISAELPEHEEFIHEVAIPTLEKRYGIKTTIVQGSYSYKDCFYKQYEKGGKIGKIWDFPFLRGPWCNTRLKTRPLKKYTKTIGAYTEVVGIAADEKKRIGRKTVQGKFLPLVEYGVTEKQAFEICERAGLLSPAYNGGRMRLGCWFCHNQRISELRRLRKEHPELWLELLELDKESPCTFKPEKTVHDLEKRFSEEELQLSLFDFT